MEAKVISSLTPKDGRASAAFDWRPKPFFSIFVSLPSPHMTGTNSTPRLRSSVRNLSALCKARDTVSLFPANIT